MREYDGQELGIAFHQGPDGTLNTLDIWFSLAENWVIAETSSGPPVVYTLTHLDADMSLVGFQMTDAQRVSLLSHYVIIDTGSV